MKYHRFPFPFLFSKTNLNMQNSMDRCIPEKYIPLVIVLPAVTFVVGVIGAIIFSITVGVG